MNDYPMLIEDDDGWWVLFTETGAPLGPYDSREQAEKAA